MNELIAAGAALILALSLWKGGKKPKNTFQNDFQTNNAPKNYSSLIIKKRDAKTKNSFVISTKSALQSPKTSTERTNLLKKLKKYILSGPEERLFAVQTASEWGDSEIIPILKIGLRDFDSRIVIKSAEAISKFKSKPKISNPQQKTNHPLNVSRMR